jgi:hypothetical protein
MKTEELNLTIDELDILCRLYMDSKLSVLEEKELEYLLSQTSLTSPAVREVRSLMGIQLREPSASLPISKKKLWNWRNVAGIAASVSILFGIGFTLFKTDNPQTSVSVNCIAYVNGEKIHGAVAMAQIESETRKTEEFISKMTELEEEEQNKIDQFMNHQNNM